jgi:hypothetical protein
MVIVTDRVMNFAGYGFKLVPGENTLPDNIPHGLQCSLERHEAAGSLRIVRNDSEPEAASTVLRRKRKRRR